MRLGAIFLVLIMCASVVGAEETRMKLTSSTFSDGEMIPKKYSGEGENISPPLLIETVPENTKSLALICDDPDAPSGLWIHWVLFNIPSDTKELPEKTPTKSSLSNGSIQGVNGSGSIGYEGPMPPSGIHRYYFKVYALDSMLKLRPGIKAADLRKAIEGHVIAQATLMGKYKRA